MKEFFAIIKKGIGIFLGALLLVIGGWDWSGELASSGDHQYPHHAFFFGGNPRGVNHSVDDLQEEREPIVQMLGQLEKESMEEEKTLPKLYLVTPTRKLVPLFGPQL